MNMAVLASLGGAWLSLAASLPIQEALATSPPAQRTLATEASPLQKEPAQGTSRPTGALGPPSVAGAAEALELKLAGRVNDQRAAKLVRDLVALGPRMGGTESGALSAAFLTKEFASYRLDVKQHLAPKKWCHEETDWALTVTVEGEEPRAIERTWPWGFSPAGRGKSIELLLEAAPGLALLSSEFRATPRSEEPCALVISDGLTTHDGEWPRCVDHRRRQNARVAVLGISKPEGARLRKALADGKRVSVDWHLETTIRQAQPITVVGTIPARQPAASQVAIPHLLICAHGDSDSGGPGANDNGSGMAIVLEMARAWKAAVLAGELPSPSVEVRFAIWGSEIHSTKAYRDSDLGRGVIAVLNFDQAGFGSTADRLHVEPDDVEGNVPFVRLAADVLRQFSGQPGFPTQWATNKSLGGTDSYIFSGWKRFRTEKLPSVTMFTSAWDKPDEQPRTQGMPGESWRERDQVEMDYDRHYHSSGDTPENTTDKEPHNMGWCARVGLITALRYVARR